MNDYLSRRRYLRLAGGSLSASSALAGCLGGKLDTKPVQVGALLPLSASGFLETVAKHHRRAIEQAVTDINDAGGPLGRELKLTVEDTELDPKTAKTAFDSLVDSGVVGLVGPVVTDISMALADSFAEEEVIAVSPSSTHPALASAAVTDATKYFARTAANDIQQALVMAKILNSERFVGAETVAIVHVDNSFGEGLASVIDEKITGKTVETVAFPPGRETYSGRVSRVVRSGADAVAFVAEPGNVTILQRLARSSFDGEFVLSEGIIPGDVPSYMDGMYSASVAAEQTTGSIKLRQELDDITPLAPYTQHAYDATFLLGTAIQQAGTATGTAISNNLVSVSGGTGQTVSVDEFGRAVTLIDADRTVNYQGASSSVDLNENLEPLNAYIIERVDGDGMDELELLRASFFQGRTA
ncbi:amino acid/amide ABC transporter substrate-binding protein, HAAT family [Haladaptatus paucihalophilus DX253]|uniref:Amino acid/amide ABC transporter substrate-binding protein, HAAT family n=1 Tax=Haladaptatus paucihalophilus DX253 TaxID=797209 RepID=A0A1M6PF18_HALPU|nr:amino acid/amide ABC transporter substrate-binding protein, HAAT family [Haladaptatus paucihalophilus DX253]